MKRWTALPLLVAGALLGGCSLLLLANLAMLAFGTGRPIRIMAPLHGVTAARTLPISVDAVLDGRFQAEAGSAIGELLPLYPGLVRIRNQIAWSVFDEVAVPGVVLGRDDNLIELAYVTDWCSRDQSRFERTAPAWAHRIRVLQDEVEAGGQVFVYVLTPSKVAQYPGLIPDSIACPSRPSDRTALVPSWVRMLRGDGVHVVDTTAIVGGAHGAYPFALYPRGGVHWNWVGATLATQAVVSLVDALHPGLIRPFGFTWHDARPDRTDTDLARLINTIREPLGEPTPSVTLLPARGGPCRRARVAIVGGSFSERIGALLSRDACAPEVVEFEYWHRLRLTWRDGAPSEGAVDADERARTLLNADVLIYEENETGLDNPLHGEALAGFFGRRR